MDCFKLSQDLFRNLGNFLKIPIYENITVAFRSPLKFILLKLIIITLPWLLIPSTTLLVLVDSTTKTALNSLEFLQRRALKPIFNLLRLTPTNQLYERVRSLEIYPLGPVLRCDSFSCVENCDAEDAV